MVRHHHLKPHLSLPKETSSGWDTNSVMNLTKSSTRVKRPIWGNIPYLTFLTLICRDSLLTVYTQMKATLKVSGCKENSSRPTHVGQVVFIWRKNWLGIPFLIFREYMPCKI